MFPVRPSTAVLSTQTLAPERFGVLRYRERTREQRTSFCDGAEKEQFWCWFRFKNGKDEAHDYLCGGANW